MPVRESSAPVGSSAKMMSGRGTSARATATRCCWPPDSWLGRLPSRFFIATVCTTVSNHARSGCFDANVSGRRMFSSAVSDGIRLYCWKMNPSRSRRSSVNAVLSRPESAVSPMYTSPDVSRSRPATHCISVLLPEPDGPMIAVNCCRGNDVHPGERMHRGVAGAVGLPGVLSVCGRALSVVAVMAPPLLGRRPWGPNEWNG